VTANQIQKFRYISTLRWEHFGIIEINEQPNPPLDTSFLFMQSMRGVRAFFKVSQMLNITCDGAMRTSRLPGPSTSSSEHPVSLHPENPFPVSLFPTPRQLTVPHRLYIDIIPFPNLRDRILASQDTINELQLILDLMADDWRFWGAEPWEPEGWEIGERFAAKWWFLLDDEILRMTNFWRKQRALQPLRLNRVGVGLVTSDVARGFR